MVIAIMIVVLGLIAIKSMPIEQYPDITPPVVEVTAQYQGSRRAHGRAERCHADRRER